MDAVTPSAENKNEEKRRPRVSALKRQAPLLIIVLVAAVVFAMGWHRHLSLENLVKHRSELEAFVRLHTVGAVSAFVGIYIVAVALSLPGAVFLTIAGGLLFGCFLGGSAALVGAAMGATIIFVVASSAFGGILMRAPAPLVAKVAEGFHADAFSYLLFLRLVPVFPFWLVNLAAALVGIRFSTFIGATVLGIIPGTFAYAFVGAGLDSVLAAQEAAFRQCLDAGRTGCRLDFDLAAALTPQLVGALVVLGLVALLPVLVKRMRGRSSNSTR